MIHDSVEHIKCFFFFHPTPKLPSPATLHMQNSRARYVEYMQTLYIYQYIIIIVPPFGEGTGRTGKKKKKKKQSTRGGVFTHSYKTAYTK